MHGFEGTLLLGALRRPAANVESKSCTVTGEIKGFYETRVGVFSETAAFFFSISVAVRLSQLATGRPGGLVGSLVTF